MCDVGNRGSYVEMEPKSGRDKVRTKVKIPHDAHKHCIALI